jgi:hypothetical protein
VRLHLELLAVSAVCEVCTASVCQAVVLLPVLPLLCDTLAVAAGRVQAPLAAPAVYQCVFDDVMKVSTLSEAACVTKL